MGPKDTSEFIRNDVIIKANAYETEKGISVFFQLEMPKNRKVRLASHIVHTTTLSAQDAFKIHLPEPRRFIVL